MIHVRRMFAIGIAAAVQLVGESHAFSQIVPMSLSDMALKATSIVHGKVLGTECKWLDDERGNHIYTVATIEVEDVMKGNAAQDILTVAVQGGTVGEITEWVSSTGSLQEGEEVVLFLGSRPGEIIGGPQGKFAVSSGKIYLDSKGVGVDEFMQAIRDYVSDPATGPALDAVGSGRSGFQMQRGTLIEEPSSMRLDESLSHATKIPDANQNPSRQPAPAKTNGWVTIHSQTFEGTFPTGLWAGAGNPTWDDQSYLAHAGSKSAWCAQGGTSGLPASGGQYANNMSSWMVFGPFDLSDAADAEMVFWFNNSSQPSADYFRCMASINGTNFSGVQWSGNSGGWVNYNFDLTNVYTLGNLAGQPQVWIAFVFASNSSQAAYAGAFVDDVVIQKYQGVLPTISNITPSKASAGTSTPVTITGTNFGATQGTVNFFYRSGQPTIPGTITSWSNTEITCQVPVATVNGYPASAGSGPVTVTTSDGATGAGYAFRVSFGYGRTRWPGAYPVIDYYINENYGGAAGEGAQVQASTNSWSNAGALFTMHYAGSTSVTANSYDGVNAVMWSPLGTGILGQTSYWSNASGIVECDFAFSSNYSWSTDGTPGGSEYDVQSTALHELGHWLNLRDLYGDIGDAVNDAAKIMYGFGSAGAVKRTLHADDVAGIQWIYGASGLPVQISSMTAVQKHEGSVELRWTTLSETQNYGFQVERSAEAMGGFVPLANGFVAGHGTTVEPHTYEYIDATAGVASWYYRLNQIDLDGSSHYTDAIRVQFATGIEEGGTPAAFSLAQNYPNPFNPATRIDYRLPMASHVRLLVFNSLGQQVATIVDGEVAAGSHQVEFDAARLAGGVYFYRIQAGAYVETRRLVVLK
ncbi:MAG: Fibronectin type domain protein [Bacteroidetes bacterium]|nr:Fibronectin type domain protein [Bacteroidota bacterium]